MAVHHLPVVKKDDYFPSFSRPQIIGFYSTDENRKFIPSSVNLKYLSRPSQDLRIDLNIGFEVYVSKAETLENEEKIDSLLHWLFLNKYLRNLTHIKDPSYTFICFRGLLTTIMRTPYEQQEDWFIGAQKVKNVIFLCAFHTDNKKAKIQVGKVEKEQRFEFWGRKFEQYLLTGDPCRKPNVTSPVVANEEFSLVFHSKIKNHNIIYGAETDGVCCAKFDDPNSQLVTVDVSRFIELKTNRIIQNSHQDRNFKKFKLLKWWTQSFIVGIQKIICGFRNDNGIICHMRDYKTSDIPKIAKAFWSPCVCMRFLDDFLNFVKTVLKDESDMTQWRFDWKPNSAQVTAQKMKACREYKILPDWFYPECKNFSGSFE